MTKELVEVVQADRDAAADWATAIMIFTKAERDAMREGVVDHATLVQAFARHRVSAEAAIVAWLKEIASGFQPSMNSKAALEFAADTLEQGKHRHG